MARDEFELINEIRKKAIRHPGLLLGIGDDTAILSAEKGENLLVTADMLMQGVHFHFPETPAQAIGRKALGVNLSDIAAMAGTPVATVISLALPKSHDHEFVENLYQGINLLAEEFEVSLAGGDTNTWDGPFVINVTVLGYEHEKGSVLRSGAKPGDWIMTTGSFGNSRKERQFQFTPRVHEAIRLRELFDLNAMIDVSDGLAADLYHILEESGTGAILDAASVPIHSDVKDSHSDKSPLEQALGDGEDFELLFTMPGDQGQELLKSPPFQTRISKIGEITDDEDALIRMPDGEVVPLPRLGWEHLS